MVDHLLSYYNRELEFLRKMGAAFADAHPRIAGRLRLTADAVEDPHVQQLLQSVAFLTARLRHRIDDDFPELTDALLGVLYPHYLHPVPAMSIVHFKPEPDLDASYVIPTGLELESEAVGGDSCRFRTCYDTTLWPVSVANASLTGRPLVAPNNPRATGAVASLRLTLEWMFFSALVIAYAPVVEMAVSDRRKIRAQQAKEKRKEEIREIAQTVKNLD